MATHQDQELEQIAADLKRNKAAFDQVVSQSFPSQSNSTVQIQFQGEMLQVQPSQDSDLLMSTTQVAKGFGCGRTTIRMCKTRNADELQEGVHWRVAQVVTAVGLQKSVCWTRLGIIKLGLFIKSPRAAEFRDWVAQLALDKIESTAVTPTTLRKPALVASPKGDLPSDVYECLLTIGNKQLRNQLLSLFKQVASSK